MKNFRNKTFLLISTILLLTSASCTKDTNKSCTKMLKGSWDLDTDESKIWIDGVLTPDTTTNAQRVDTFTKDGKANGTFTSFVSQTIPYSVQQSTLLNFEITEDCSIFRYDGDFTTGGWIDANIQTLTASEFVYDYTLDLFGEPWKWELHFDKQ